MFPRISRRVRAIVRRAGSVADNEGYAISGHALRYGSVVTAVIFMLLGTMKKINYPK